MSNIIGLIFGSISFLAGLYVFRTGSFKKERMVFSLNILVMIMTGLFTIISLFRMIF